RYNGPSNKSDIAYALTIDSGGNVYVAGASTAANDYSDYATVKYDGVGNQLWVKRFNGFGNNNDVAKAITVDGAGNIYVTGSSVGSNGLRDYVTIKYNSAGAQQWSRRYNGAGNHHDEANALVVDGNGNVYATGSSVGSNGNQDYATIKYNSVGTQLWVKRYNGLGNNNDIANALAVDGSGNVYVTGSSTVSNGFYDYVTVKYNNMGVQQWASRYNGSGNHNDEAKAIALDGTGNVYVTGSSVGSNEFQDYVTVKYNSAGSQQWAIRYYGLANKNDIANAIAVDGAGNVYVTGASAAVNGYYNYVTIKYLATSASSAFAETSFDDSEFNDSDGDTLTEIDKNTTLPTSYNLEQNFPNPFNPLTTIRFATPTAGKVKLTVFNVRGELVRTLVDGEVAAGYHNITFDASDLASGVYFYRLEARAFTATQKMIVTK
ncbi:MAG: SBBP repeat-containing protein, partial [bacterium]